MQNEQTMLEIFRSFLPTELSADLNDEAVLPAVIIQTHARLVAGTAIIAQLLQGKQIADIPERPAWWPTEFSPSLTLMAVYDHAWEEMRNRITSP
ncbi:MAG: hypothetical protein OXC99_01470 [Chloroflexi bacterium]|nr:hypothetical protein [Chloroflexota bacterium]